MNSRGGKSRTDNALAVFGMAVPTTEAGTTVISRDKKSKGKTTGGCFRCRLDGCFGLRISVRWENGRITFPCSKGMARSKKGWRII